MSGVVLVWTSQLVLRPLFHGDQVFIKGPCLCGNIVTGFLALEHAAQEPLVQCWHCKRHLPTPSAGMVARHRLAQLKSVAERN